MANAWINMHIPSYLFYCTLITLLTFATSLFSAAHDYYVSMVPVRYVTQFEIYITFRIYILPLPILITKNVQFI